MDDILDSEKMDMDKLVGEAMNSFRRHQPPFYSSTPCSARFTTSLVLLVAEDDGRQEREEEEEDWDYMRDAIKEYCRQRKFSKSLKNRLRGIFLGPRPALWFTPARGARH